jgi:hypothetical protein
VVLGLWWRWYWCWVFYWVVLVCRGVVFAVACFSCQPTACSLAYSLHYHTTIAMLYSAVQCSAVLLAVLCCCSPASHIYTEPITALPLCVFLWLHCPTTPLSLVHPVCLSVRLFVCISLGCLMILMPILSRY